jgi:hypothetical protein
MNFLNPKEDKKSYMLDEEQYFEFIDKNPGYEKCPYIDWEKRKQANMIIFESDQFENTSNVGIKLINIDSNSNPSTISNSPFETTLASKVHNMSIVSLKSEDLSEVQIEKNSSDQISSKKSLTKKI